MTNSTKQTAALIAASEAFNQGQDRVGKVFEAIAADYDNTPADAEWVSKREGWESISEVGDRYNNFHLRVRAVHKILLATSMTVIRLYYDGGLIITNPTRAQVIALERAVGVERKEQE